MTTVTAPSYVIEGRAPRQESLFAHLGPWLEKKAVVPPPEPPAPEKARDLSHTWVAAAEIEVTPRTAALADFRDSFKAAAGQRIEALEGYCRGCRRPTTRSRVTIAPRRSTTGTSSAGTSPPEPSARSSPRFPAHALSSAAASALTLPEYLASAEHATQALTRVHGANVTTQPPGAAPALARELPAFSCSRSAPPAHEFSLERVGLVRLAA